MPVILNISERRPLPEVEVEALRDIARHNPTETLIVGQRRMTLHYIQFMDRFSVEPLPGTLFERLGDGRHRRLAENLERQLNGGGTFLQEVATYMAQARSAPSVPVRTRDTAQGRINSYAFPVNPGDFPCGEQHLSCPITLFLKWVFLSEMRRAQMSALYMIGMSWLKCSDATIHILSAGSPLRWI